MNERICYVVDVSGWMHKAWSLNAYEQRRITSDQHQINTATKKLRDRANGLVDELRALYAEGIDTEAHAALDSGKTWRHTLYPLYKAQRKPKTPAQLEFFKRAPQILLDAGLEVWSSPGFEADDIIARIATARAAEGWEVRVVTDDHDLFQLASDRIRILANKASGGKELLGVEGVEARLGFPASKLPLMKALTGDSSDNFLGCRGIGAVQALPLVRSYDNIDAIYADLEHIPAPTRKKLEAAALECHPRLFEQLATLSRDLPLKRVVSQLVAT